MPTTKGVGARQPTPNTKQGRGAGTAQRPLSPDRRSDSQSSSGARETGSEGGRPAPSSPAWRVQNSDKGQRSGPLGDGQAQATGRVAQAARPWRIPGPGVRGGREKSHCPRRPRGLASSQCHRRRSGLAVVCPTGGETETPGHTELCPSPTPAESRLRDSSRTQSHLLPRPAHTARLQAELGPPRSRVDVLTPRTQDGAPTAVVRLT